MKLLGAGVVAAALTMLAVSPGAMAQSSYDDLACRQYAEQQIAPLRDQINAQAAGSALVGAGLGAAIGGAVGGGRGAGIGAASGAIWGAGAGAANAADAQAYLAQQWDAHYSQCMSARAAAPPYGAPPAGYGSSSGYSPPPPRAGGSTADQLNRQELYRVTPGYAPPGYPPPR